jgi:hypothetical protein
MRAGISQRRLNNQRLARPLQGSPSELVAWLGAVQAQEYHAAKWGLAQRLRGTLGDLEIERAIDSGQILRTHVMRPTWHFVASADIRWMLELTAPRVHRTMAFYIRREGLDDRLLVKAATVFERALAGGRSLTRAELGERLARKGTRVNALQLSLLALYAELEGVICSGPRRGKHFTHALLSERAPAARRLTRDEALSELTRRFFRSHGPATIRDFVWWSGLTTADTRRGLDMIRARAESADGLTYWTVGQVRGAPTLNPTVYLLPIYDEYIVAYRDRAAVPHAPSTIRAGARTAVVFQHAMIIDGQIAGTWRNRRTPKAHVVDVVPLRRITAIERRALVDTIARYGRFLGAAVDPHLASR